jgi:hypothetical protein
MVALSIRVARKRPTPFAWASKASLAAGLSAHAREIVTSKDVAADRTNPAMAKAIKTSIRVKAPRVFPTNNSVPIRLVGHIRVIDAFPP